MGRPFYFYNLVKNMGCDIHIVCERYDAKRGAWRLTRQRPRKCTYCHGTGYYICAQEPPRPCYACGGATMRTPGLFEGRDYSAFAILADVRNEHDAPYKSIAPDRGVPETASAEYWKLVESWADGHSHSYVTLAELEAFNWADVHRGSSGLLSATQYAYWWKKQKKIGEPRLDYCSAVSGGTTRTISNKHMQELLSTGYIKVNAACTHATATDGLHYYTRAHWNETYADAAGELYSSTIPMVRKIRDRYQLKDTAVRICFFFDN